MSWWASDENTVFIFKQIQVDCRKGHDICMWHFCLFAFTFGQTLGDGEGQGSLACCSLWGRKEPDTTEQLDDNKTIKPATPNRISHEGWFISGRVPRFLGGILHPPLLFSSPECFPALTCIMCSLAWCIAES